MGTQYLLIQSSVKEAKLSLSFSLKHTHTHTQRHTNAHKHTHRSLNTVPTKHHLLCPKMTHAHLMQLSHGFINKDRPFLLFTSAPAQHPQSLTHSLHISLFIPPQSLHFSTTPLSLPPLSPPPLSLSLHTGLFQNSPVCGCFFGGDVTREITSGTR